ncbi:diguanylate cyclase [Bacillus sp. OxB-1]|uniref:putative bifunctional diguanylate cyclase/phosphodiesterase n=1 Tax=Bacillus sp. (strain OxB-1) TaxID=98228 RepID=UPI0005822534|nr:EAL domain-containing protein [Bacillus sp. OxB-1]BAQ10954.1 diguanylate cyclase [Bacillus sp. OxB-1]
MNSSKQSFASSEVLSEYPKELSEKVFMTVDEGIMITDKNRRIVHVNPAFEQVTGYRRDEVVGQTPRILQSGVHTAHFYQNMMNVLDKEGRWNGEIWNRRKNGEIYPEWLRIMEVRDDSGAVTNYLGIFVDLSDHEVALKNLKDASMTDTLTKVGNRQSFYHRMEVLFNSGEEDDKIFAILFLDLDRFKQINDTLGHAIGDELLKEFARRLRKLLKNKDIIARIGGDEFVIALTGLKHSGEAAIFAERILEKLERPHHIGSYELFISSSIGISLYPQDGKSLDDLLKKADLAMYESKRSGRNNYTFFYEDLVTDVTRMIELETRLLTAIEERKFSLTYQPKIDMTTGRIVGVESFVHCPVCQNGPEAIDDFTPIAEELGLMVPITDIALVKVCEDLLMMQAEGVDPGRVSINISAIYFMQPNLIESLTNTIRRFGLSPRQFELEIAESVVMANGERSIQILSALKAVGFSVAIDHFGNGFSSLGLLSRISVDTIKIDRIFIQNIFEADENRIIVDMIIQMANRLGIAVAADGVEHIRQMKLLRSMGCALAQGGYVSDAICQSELGEIIAMFDEMGTEWEVRE